MYHVLDDFRVKMRLKVYIHIAVEKVMNIQNKITDAHQNSKDRFEIIQAAFIKKHMAMQREVPRKKKAREQLALVKAISDEVRDAVITRYLRYCKDQFGFNFLSYRRMINASNLSYSETLGLRLAIGKRKRDLREHERDLGLVFKYRTAAGLLVLEAEKLGRPVESLIPCLDPDFPAKQKTRQVLAKRYDENQGVTQLGAGSSNSSSADLAANFPVDYQFFPSDAVLTKLVTKCTRIAEISHIKSELWAGFDTKQEYALPSGYRPKKLLCKELVGLSKEQFAAFFPNTDADRFYPAPKESEN